MLSERAIDLEMRIGPITHPLDRVQRVPTPEEEEDMNNLSDNSLSGLELPRQQSSRNSSTNMLNPILHSPHGSDENRNRQGERGEPNQLPDGQGERVEPAIRRPLPQPRPFEGTNNRNIRQFFDTYERFAHSMWGNRKNDWVAGLEVLLQGWALVLYRGLVDQNLEYNKIKHELSQAFPGSVDPLRTKTLLKMINLQREHNEPLPVFYSRISQLIRETYPDLNEYSHNLQVRDTFLMKVPPGVAEQIAQYCNARGDFQPNRVREAAMIITNTNTPNFQTSGENVFLAQANVEQKQNPVLQKVETGLKCYICAGSWHAVSACPLYPLVFSCPWCRSEPHPVTECSLYNDWVQFKRERDNADERNNRRATRDDRCWETNPGEQ